MATKVFYRCKTQAQWWTFGREYQLSDGIVIDDDGSPREEDFMDTLTMFQRIERETFTANGFKWFKHTPGDAIPCDRDSVIHALCKWEAEKGEGHDVTDKAKHFWFSQRGSYDDIIGWRFADSERKEPAITFSQAQDGTNWNVADFGVVPYDAQSNSPQPLSDGKLWPLGGLDAKRFNENAGCIGDSGTVLGRAWIDPFPADVWIGVDFAEDPSERNDLIAAVDDGHLTPGQKAYIQGKEDAQAAKQQLKHDAEAKALQERADQLADAGRAMDVVRDGFTHKLGWMQ